jgi:hypothetical protein
MCLTPESVLDRTCQALKNFSMNIPEEAAPWPNVHGMVKMMIVATAQMIRLADVKLQHRTAKVRTQALLRKLSSLEVETHLMYLEGV